MVGWRISIKISYNVFTLGDKKKGNGHSSSFFTVKTKASAIDNSPT